MGIKQRGGRLHTEVIPDLKTKTIRPIVERQVQEGATISTDEMRSYNLLEVSAYNWGSVNHEQKEWARGTTRIRLSHSGICSKRRLLQRTFIFRGSISTSTCGNLLSARTTATGGTRCLIFWWRVFDEAFG
jgi:transposase-like protein